MYCNLKDRFFYFLPYDLRRILFSIRHPKLFRSSQGQRMLEDSSVSFKPFDDLKCIYIHVPKTAGYSINKTLFGNQGGAHTMLSHYQLIFSKREFNGYFKFTVIRNPWDRLFSAYNFLKKGGGTKEDKKYSETTLSAYNNFEDFVLNWVNRANILECVYFIPQYKFLCLPHSYKIHVDFIGFFENLENDFQYIKKRLFLDVSLELKKINVTSPNKLDYKDFYSTEMRDIVSKVYKEDIALFGYNFESSTLKEQIRKRKETNSSKL